MMRVKITYTDPQGRSHVVNCRIEEAPVRLLELSMRRIEAAVRIAEPGSEWDGDEIGGVWQQEGGTWVWSCMDEVLIYQTCCLAMEGRDRYEAEKRRNGGDAIAAARACVEGRV